MRLTFIIRCTALLICTSLSCYGAIQGAQCKTIYHQIVSSSSVVNKKQSVEHLANTNEESNARTADTSTIKKEEHIDWSSLAIPSSKKLDHETTVHYHNQQVDTNSRIGQEPLVDVKEIGIRYFSHYARIDNLNEPYCRKLAGSCSTVKVRKSIADMLLKVNDSLRKYEIELILLDGYRTLECQKSLWDFFIEEGKRFNPTGKSEHIEQYALRYCSSPSNFDQDDYKTWPTHMTGGSVDLTLRSMVTGEWLFMGGIFDDPSEVSSSDYFERMVRKGQNLTASQRAALRNRRILYWSMTSQGFTNYPEEWWHYDWGNQLWLYTMKMNKSEKSSVKETFRHSVKIHDGLTIIDEESNDHLNKREIFLDLPSHAWYGAISDQR